MSDMHRVSGVVKWWALIVVGTGAALLVAWLSHLAGVSPSTVLSIGVGAVALGWLIVLVAVPWNLYFAARRAAADMAISRARGIGISVDQEAEAGRIARRLLWFALGGHAITAGVAAVVTYFSGAALGYYVTGAYLLSAAIRPAAAYYAHLRERITVLSRDSRYPREDVVLLRGRTDKLASLVEELTNDLRRSGRDCTEDLRRTESRLADEIAHARQVLGADLGRLQDAQAADRDAARARDEELSRRIDTMIRRIDETLSGLGDQQELLTGLRALVRMVRSEPAQP
jgi:hypothetical protein